MLTDTAIPMLVSDLHSAAPSCNIRILREDLSFSPELPVRAAGPFCMGKECFTFPVIQKSPAECA